MKIYVNNLNSRKLLSYHKRCWFSLVSFWIGLICFKRFWTILIQHFGVNSCDSCFYLILLGMRWRPRHAHALKVKLLWHPKNAPEWLPLERIDGDQHPLRPWKQNLNDSTQSSGHITTNIIKMVTWAHICYILPLHKLDPPPHWQDFPVYGSQEVYT